MAISVETIKVCFWPAISEHAPAAWAELATCADVDAWLTKYHLDGPPWIREQAIKQLELWREIPIVKENLWPLVSVRNSAMIPRELTTFHFDLPGWRPDLTIGEQMAESWVTRSIGNLWLWLVQPKNSLPPGRFGLFVDGTGQFSLVVDDTEHSTGKTGESEKEAETRIRKAFEAALELHLQAVREAWEERLADKRLVEKHCAWLVKRLVMSASIRSFASEGERHAVTTAVRKLADLLGFTLPPPAKGGRPAGS